MNEVITAWGRVAVSAIGQILLAVALVMAYQLGNDTILNIVVGAIVANGTTIVQYYLGSSASSNKKDEVVAALLPKASS